MMRFILNLIRFVLAIYLLVYIILSSYILSQKEFYENDFPTIEGYSYIKAEDNDLSPKLKTNEYALTKRTTIIKENDIIAYTNHDGNVAIGKVKTVKNKNITVVKKDKTDKIEDKQLLGKVIYTNATLSKVLNIITKWYVAIIILVIIYIIPTVAYKRY